MDSRLLGLNFMHKFTCLLDELESLIVGIKKISETKYYTEDMERVFPSKNYKIIYIWIDAVTKGDIISIYKDIVFVNIQIQMQRNCPSYSHRMW